MVVQIIYTKNKNRNFALTSVIISGAEVPDVPVVSNVQTAMYQMLHDELFGVLCFTFSTTCSKRSRYKCSCGLDLSRGLNNTTKNVHITVYIKLW